LGDDHPAEGGTGGKDVWLRNGTVAAAAAAAAACLCAPASAATVNAQVQAKVVKPLTIQWRQDLDFGTILLGTGTWSATTVHLSQAGALTCPAPLTCSGGTQVAIYNVAGTKQQSVAITVPNVTLVNQSDSSKTLTLVPDAATTLTLANSGAPGSNFSIGGSITVSSTTADGTYAGTFNVTADYQ
jgi:hypothetical protein